MNYKIIIALLFITLMSACALEKEDSDQLYGVYQYTIASASIDNITQNSENKKNFTINYTISSEGKLGKDPVSDIKNSYIEILSAKIYLYKDNNKLEEFDILNELPDGNKQLVYNNNIKGEIDISLKNELQQVEYTFSIIIQGREYNGKGFSTSSVNEFSGELKYQNK